MTTSTKKPTAFVFGAPKKDAPPIPQISKERMEQIEKDVEKYLKQLKIK